MQVPDFKKMADQSGGRLTPPLVVTTMGVAAFAFLFKPVIGHAA